MKDESRISWLSRRELVLIIVGGIVSATWGLVLSPPVSSTYDFTPLIYSANTVSMIFATGLFYFLTAGLLFSSRTSHLHLLSKINEFGIRKAFLIRTLHVIVITSLFTTIFILFVFLYPVILVALAYYPVSFDHFVFFPAVLGASLVGSIPLALIASSLAVLTDDSRVCIVLGCLSTLLIAFLGGWNTTPTIWHYSLTRNLAFLSPHNIVRALAVLFSGFQFESTERMVQYVGFAFSAESLIVALLSLGSISFVLLILGQKVLLKNSDRWAPLGSMPPSHEIWPTAPSPERSQEITRMKRSLQIQRGLATLVVVALIISASVGVQLYAAYISGNTAFIHYMSPDDNEELSVGAWNVYDVDVQPPFPGLINSLSIFINVNSWGNASNSLSFYCGIVNMSSTEFNSLDEASRLAFCPHPFLNRTSEEGAGFGYGETFEESYGPYVCVLLIIADTNPMEHSYIEASLRIVQESL